MKLIIDGTPEEIKKMLNTICGSEEHDASPLFFRDDESIYERH